MGLSHFKTRYELLLEKAQLKKEDFEDNEYTQYGNVMEPKIRQYVNVFYQRNFKEDKLINGDIRCHFDGIDDDMILEIKTTSHIYENVNDYETYLVQLLFYMMNANKKNGILAVYERPKDFDEKFDSDKLRTYVIDIENYQKMCNAINEAVEQFRIDLNKLKENPFFTEEDLMPKDVVSIANEVIKLEDQFKKYKDLTQKREDFMKKLKVAMEENNIKTWETPTGVKFTLVEDKPNTEVEEEYYNEDLFMQQNLDLHQAYHNKLAEYKEKRKVLKKGKKGYVLITFRNE